MPGFIVSPTFSAKNAVVDANISHAVPREAIRAPDWRLAMNQFKPKSVRKKNGLHFRNGHAQIDITPKLPRKIARSWIDYIGLATSDHSYQY